MNGSWHLYRHGERWWRGAAGDARPDRHRRLGRGGVRRAGRGVRDARSDLATRDPVAALGPDLLGADVRSRRSGPAHRRQRPRRRSRRALLDQRLVAGIGNVYKSEVLFRRRRASGDARRARCRVAVLERLIDIARGRCCRRQRHRRDVGGDPDLSQLANGEPRGADTMTACGSTAAGQAVPQVRHADRVEEDGPRRAHHLLVLHVSDTWCQTSVSRTVRIG